MRVQDSAAGSNELFYLLSDQLGSTTITTNSSGSKVAELRYQAWGETRYAWGATPTDYRFTGQREEGALGLYFYNARWYDPALGRFIQADTLVAEPGNPLDWDRYAYVYNNPLIYTDPSGHKLDPFGDDFGGRNVVQLGGVYLKGGPGTPYNGFAVEAEEEFTDHSGGGYSLPAFESISLANLFLVWFRDNTPAREWLGNSLPGVFGTPKVYGQVF
jgi:RHS repeat-associated protein